MTLLLVDGNNLLARSIHAAQATHADMSVGGVNTAPLVIFVNSLGRYVRMVKPDSILVCWDNGHLARDQAYPAYKAARKSHSGEEQDQYVLAKTFLTFSGIHHRQVAGYEADDLIAAAARQTNQDVVILSGDKDLLQLVDDGDSGNPAGLEPPTYGSTTQIRMPDDVPWDSRRVKEKFGVYPEHLALYLALVGDPGDGVPGVRGIGPKKALALLQEAENDWNTVLGLLGEEKADDAVVMRSLVDLRDMDYPQPFMDYNRPPPPWRPVGPDDASDRMSWDALREFCETFLLNSILERLVNGTLWVGQESLKPSTEGLFGD